MKTPKLWRRGTLADLIGSVRGGFSVQCEDRLAGNDEKGVLKTGSVLSGRFDSSQHKFVPEQDHGRLRTPVMAGSIIFCRKNSEDTVGGSALVDKDHVNLYLSDLLWEIRANETVDQRWLALLLQSEHVRSNVRLWSTGTQNTMKNISQDRLLAVPVSIPPPLEQTKIVKIIRTWNDAIYDASRIYGAKSSRYRAICKRLFVSSIEGTHSPRLVRLAEISSRVRRPNDGSDLPVMTISAKSGFLLQSDKYTREMAGKSLENYVVLRCGEFAYNKGNSLTSPQGCIFRLGEEKALVPHVYFCFALREDLHADYFVHVFESGYLNQQLSRVINSGVRNDGLLNLAPEDFFNCSVPLPSLEDQLRVAEFLNELKRELEFLERQVALLEQQKRGLMQKLLTGEWRLTC